MASWNQVKRMAPGQPDSTPICDESSSSFFALYAGLGLKDVPDLLPKHRPPPHPADMADTHTDAHTRTHKREFLSCLSFCIYSHLKKIVSSWRVWIKHHVFLGGNSVVDQRCSTLRSSLAFSCNTSYGLLHSLMICTVERELCKPLSYFFFFFFYSI